MLGMLSLGPMARQMDMQLLEQMATQRISCSVVGSSARFVLVIGGLTLAVDGIVMQALETGVSEVSEELNDEATRS